MSGLLLDRIAVDLPGLRATLDELATPDLLFAWFQAIADTPAPSQTASRTRGLVVKQRLEDRGVLGLARYESDYQGTGSDLLVNGKGGARIVAHLDEISYLIAGDSDNDGWPLTAFCYSLADGPRAARVIRWLAEGYRVVDAGVVDGAGDLLRYRSNGGADLTRGDRVCLHSPAQIHAGGGRLTGSMDNAGGVAAALVAAEVLMRHDVPFSLVLPDEEEGPAGLGSMTMSIGAMRVFPVLPEAELTHVLSERGLAATDGHRLPWGASLAESSSMARGGVTPPPLYAALRGLAAELTAAGMPVRESDGYVPRSDDVAAQLFTRELCLIGYPCANRHFDHGLPATNLNDLCALAAALAVTAAATSLGALPTRRHE
jgi:hypothetical protein